MDGSWQPTGPTLWCCLRHDANSPPIARAVRVFSDGNRLVGDIEFAPPEVNEFADSIYKLVAAGYLKAGSVGFLPLEWSFAEDKNRPFGIDFKRQELLEFSICPVPALPSALIEAQARGINTRPLSRWADASGFRERLRRLAELRSGSVRHGYCETVEDRVARARALRTRFAGEEIDPRVLVADAEFRLQGLR